MSKSSKSRQDIRPTHIQAGESLAALLERGQPGERLPAEPVLAAQLGVSRATLREVLRSFEERGRIVRRHGVGTFIAPPRPVIESGLEILESIDRLARRSGLKTRMDTATIEERPARQDELKALGLKSATLILSVARIIVTGAQPVACLLDLVPVEYLRQDDLDDLDETFNGSVLDLFIKRGQPTLAHSRTDLIATTADAAMARQLHIQRNAPLLKLEAQLYAQDNRIVDYSISHFVPGYFRFHVVRRIST
jgi:GntR family transcriptional regulator